MTRQYVLRWALFGRSKRKQERYPNLLRFGSRHSDKLVRCYRKYSVNAFRIEIQLNHSFMRKHNLTTVDELMHFLPKLVPQHFGFYRVKKKYLEGVFKKRTVAPTPANRKFRTIWHKQSLSEALGFLRSLGIMNVRRCLELLPLNTRLIEALNELRQSWDSGFFL